MLLISQTRLLWSTGANQFLWANIIYIHAPEKCRSNRKWIHTYIYVNKRWPPPRQRVSKESQLFCFLKLLISSLPTSSLSDRCRKLFTHSSSLLRCTALHCTALVCEAGKLKLPCSNLNRCYFCASGLNILQQK